MSQLRANGVLILVGLLLAASQCKAGDIVSSLGKRNGNKDINEMPELPVELEPLVSLAGHARFVGDYGVYETLIYEIEHEHFEKTLASFVRQEMGLLFAGRDLPSLEEFGKELREKLVKPCKRLHALLEGWWQAYNRCPLRSTESETYWLITEHLCSKMAKKNEDDIKRLIRCVYKIFELKYQHDLNQEKKREKFAEEIDTIMEKATIPLHYDRMVGLVQRLVEGRGKEIRTDKDKLGYSLERVFGYLMKHELEPFVEEIGYEAVGDEMFKREFKSRFWMPCETISNSLDSWYSLYSQSGELIRENERSWYLAVHACRTLFHLEKLYREEHNDDYIMGIKLYWVILY